MYLEENYLSLNPECEKVTVKTKGHIHCKFAMDVSLCF